MNTTTHRETESQPRTRNHREEVAHRAYQLWEAARRPAGRDLEFWLQAEAELGSPRHNRSAQPAASGANPKPQGGGGPGFAPPVAPTEKAEPRKAGSSFGGSTEERQGQRPASAGARQSSSMAHGRPNSGR